MLFVFVFKQKTAYEMRISYWSSDVCSSDLAFGGTVRTRTFVGVDQGLLQANRVSGQVGQAGDDFQRRDLVAEFAGVDRGDGFLVRGQREQIGRATCRERVCKDV